jgi:toxin ParE1/3/4
MWGRNQAETYVSQLLTAAETLCEFPDRGWSVGDEPSNVRRVTAGRHIIYYRVLASEIEIIRILHQRMETPTLLS